MSQPLKTIASQTAHNPFLTRERIERGRFWKHFPRRLRLLMRFYRALAGSSFLVSWLDTSNFRNCGPLELARQKLCRDYFGTLKLDLLLVRRNKNCLQFFQIAFLSHLTAYICRLSIEALFTNHVDRTTKSRPRGDAEKLRQ